jgi:hypothetical protein
MPFYGPFPLTRKKPVAVERGPQLLFRQLAQARNFLRRTAFSSFGLKISPHQPGSDMNEAALRQAEVYRLRAEEVRTAADGTRDLQCCEALRRLADGYERLAQNLERIAAREVAANDLTGN